MSGKEVLAILRCLSPATAVVVNLAAFSIIVVGIPGVGVVFCVAKSETIFDAAGLAASPGRVKVGIAGLLGVARFEAVFVAAVLVGLLCIEDIEVVFRTADWEPLGGTAWLKAAN